MQDITLTENGNFRFRLPKTIGTVKCPVCGANSDIVEYWHPPTKTYKKLDWIESDGKCFECVKHDEAMEEFERQREEARIARIERIKKVFDEDSLMNPKLKAATFENYNPTNNDLEKAKVITKRYADHFSKENPISLLLIGNYGTGKSHLSVAITKELMDKNLSCIFISTPKLMTKIRSTYNKESDYTEEQILDQLSKVDCLGLDDIGAESVKQGDSNQHTWATSKIFEIIDNRIGKHTIFTTNYDVNELQQRLGGRNFSRMMESVHVIKMYGDDYRLKDFK
jgi:DNA replication protein DnaC